MSGNSSQPFVDDTDSWVPYRYEPTNIGAGIFIGLFFFTTTYHVFQMFRRKTWYFTPMIVGGIFEIVGYIFRIVSSNDIYALVPYILQAVLLLVAPALLAASIYIVLGRIILLVNREKYSPVRQKWLTTVFVLGDVLSFLTQAAGGGLQAQISTQKTGENVLIAGLFLQIFFFGFFVIIAGLFHYRLQKYDRSNESVMRLPWKKHLVALYASSGLILVRSIFRVIEYLMGNNGFLLRNEAFLYVFDALFMFLVMVLFNIVHPSEVTMMMKDRDIQPSSDASVKDEKLHA